ncbi:thiosulfate sulfurtransferase [Maricurvus nonylphenolicus]|uniref:rhodanese-like domain-containing protein n=1 Tax=Maricurvus nonylphenolicus TaxID=1008307 RepID=UPI0036F3802B
MTAPVLPSSSLPLIVEPQDFAKFANSAPTQDILLLDLGTEAHYAEGHVPGAVHVNTKQLILGQPPAPGRLPGVEQLSQLFSSLGLTPDTHVVVYDDEGGAWAGRMIWTLDAISHKHYSYLNGGLIAWKGDGLPLESQSNSREAAPQTVSIDTTPIAEIDDILPRLNDSNFAVWDARGPQEYSGEKVQAAKAGHIPGAINVEFTEMMDRQRDFRIRTDAREYLAEKGLNDNQDIVTHCQTHRRSGLTYLVGKMLGFNIRGYHGSWSEWGNHPDTPVEK